ncbi:hypothetical protein D9M68_617190 [compost metagenome]
MRFEDHAVDHAHQRVVRLLHGRLAGGGRGGRFFLLERLQQRAGARHVELERTRRVVHVDHRAFGRHLAEFLVGLVQHAVQVEALAQHGNDLRLRDELHLVDHRVPVDRVVERHHQAPAVQHERHHLQAPRGFVAHLAQRVGRGRKHMQVHQRVAHLAHQRGLQLAAAHDAHAHQRLAQRHGGFALLLLQRRVELRLRDHAQRHQRLADARDRHAALQVELLHELFGHDDFGGCHGWVSWWG